MFHFSPPLHFFLSKIDSHIPDLEPASEGAEVRDLMFNEDNQGVVQLPPHLRHATQIIYFNKMASANKGLQILDRLEYPIRSDYQAYSSVQLYFTGFKCIF